MRENQLSTGDLIFKFLQKCNTNANKPDLHSFKAKIKGGVVFVECRGYEVFIESYTYDKRNEICNRWVGTTIAAANRLEKLGIEFNSIDM